MEKILRTLVCYLDDLDTGRDNRVHIYVEILDKVLK